VLLDDLLGEMLDFASGTCTSINSYCARIAARAATSMVVPGVTMAGRFQFTAL